MILKVRVYWNFHRKVFSVMCGGRVVAHATRVDLYRVRFTVRRAGWLRVLRERRKNVHAFVAGTTGVRVWHEEEEASGVATYNPYGMAGATFIDADTGRPLAGADVAYLSVRDGRPCVRWADARSYGVRAW